MTSFEKVVIFDFDCTISSFHCSNFLLDETYFKQIAEMMAKKLGLGIDMIGLIRSRMIEVSNSINSVMDKRQIENYIKGETSINIDALNSIVLFLFGGQSRVDSLKGFFQSIQRKKTDLIISSRGLLGHIILLLKMTNLFEYFGFISAFNNYALYNDLVYHYPGFDPGSNIIKKVSTLSKVDLINSLISLGYTSLIYIDDDKSELNNFKHINNIKSCGFVDVGKVYTCDFLTKKGTDGLLLFFGTLERNGLGMQSFEMIGIDQLLDIPT